MNDDKPHSTEISKAGITASESVSSPVPPSEPSISSVRSDTGSRTESNEGQGPEPESTKTHGNIVVDLTQEETQVIQLLRTPKLSIKYLDDERKKKVRDLMMKLHHERGISLTDIAKLIGNKTSGYTSWLFEQLGIQARDFEEARLAGIHKKVRKYERKPFDGTDEDKAYLLGLRHGDLSAYVPFGDATRVSTSTTHPALAEVFTKLFSPYGHVYRHPRYKKDTKTYEWNLQAILDNSFRFLLDARDVCRDWIASKESTMLSYLAGIIDAEGNVGIYPAKRYTSITVAIYNTDTDLLGFVHRCLAQLGYKPLRPYLDKLAGFISPGFHIEMKRDYYRVLVARFNKAQSLLRSLPLQHREKVARKELALSISLGQPWEGIKDRVQALADYFDRETIEFTKQAELEFLKTHPEVPS